MTDREKLVELFQQDGCPLFMVFGDKVDVLADYLITNGVTFAKDTNTLTNADRIRATSDFELRQFICGSNRCETCRWSAAYGCTLMEWLKQPAKEDE